RADPKSPILPNARSVLSSSPNLNRLLRGYIAMPPTGGCAASAGPIASAPASDADGATCSITPGALMTRCSATGFLEWVRRISTFVHVDPTGASAIILGGSGYWEWQRLDAQGNLLAEATSVVAIDNQIWNI